MPYWIGIGKRRAYENEKSQGIALALPVLDD
jgi:hypothetical protein